jgi:hypothetical protein
MNRTKEQQEVADNLFDKLRDNLLTRDLSNTENYDKAILTLSASSLGLSLTAIKFVVTKATASSLILLKMGWTLLVISVISSLVAYLIGNKAIKVQLENARDYYKNGIEGAFSRKNIFSRVNSFLNYLTGLSFALAIILIVTFISINLEIGESTMSDKSKSSGRTNKSANIPNIESVTTTVGDSANVPTLEIITNTPEVGGSANIPTMEQAPSTVSAPDKSSSGNKK